MGQSKKYIGLATKAKLSKDFERACNSYRCALERMWDLNPTSGYWIADEVGGVYDNDGFVTLNMGEIIYCVENDIAESEYEEWREYNFKANEYNFDYINLKSWHRGCPRVSEETFERLKGMKRELEEAAEYAKTGLN